jgi:hypothetical protein
MIPGVIAVFERKRTGPPLLLLLLLLLLPPPPPAARLQFKKPTRTICNSFSLRERLS